MPKGIPNKKAVEVLPEVEVTTTTTDVEVKVAEAPTFTYLNYLHDNNIVPPKGAFDFALTVVNGNIRCSYRLPDGTTYLV